MAGKMEKWNEKVKALQGKIREAHAGGKEKLSATAKIAPAMPFLGGVATYVTGYGDAMVGTPENKNPITLGATVAAWGVSLWGAFAGHAKTGVAAASVATAGVGALTHDRGYAKGIEGKAKG